MGRPTKSRCATASPKYYTCTLSPQQSCRGTSNALLAQYRIIVTQYRVRSLGTMLGVVLVVLLALVSGTCEAHTPVRVGLTGGVESMPDTLLKNISEVLWSPAPTEVYLGSPSIVRTSTGALLVRSCA